MSLFGAIVRTVINVGIGLPVAIVKDVVTLGGRATNRVGTYTSEAVDLIKDEADD